MNWRWQEIIKKHPTPWRIVAASGYVNSHYVEDESIFDANNQEVLGCSEWLRAADGLLEAIVEHANAIK
jgi:hypothetical protein